jgi:hypothetical protein
MPAVQGGEAILYVPADEAEIEASRRRLRETREPG